MPVLEATGLTKRVGSGRAARRLLEGVGLTAQAGEMVAGIGAIALSGCGASSRSFAESGSTLESTWADPTGDGQLQVLAGEGLVERDELGGRAELGRLLGSLGHLTDAHVLDASSPARVTFLARLGPPFQSTFRPQEALTVQVLAGAVGALRALRPDVVVQGGDLIDNDQENELNQALAVLRGGPVQPGSGPDGYYGVQLESDPDPFYYRPGVDAPRHPGLLREAVRRFDSPGLGHPWLPVLGDHDVLVAGELVPNPLTQHLAVGDRALWSLPQGLSLPPGLRAEAVNTPDGPPLAGLAEQFLLKALQGPTFQVPPDPGRRELSVAEVAGGLRSASLAAGSDERLDYVYDLGDRLRLIVLDLASRVGGSGGRVVPGQVEFVGSALADAGERWVVFISHQTLRQSVGGDELQAVLDASPRVILLLNGHTHHNRIRVRQTPVGGHWELETASLIDWPQQARALRVYETHDGAGVAIKTWMLDHVFPGPLGRISRELSYLSAAGGRPGHFAGQRSDRNAVLYLPPR